MAARGARPVLRARADGRCAGLRLPRPGRPAAPDRGPVPPAARPPHRADRAMEPAARGRAAGRARVGGVRRRRAPTAASRPPAALDDCRSRRSTASTAAWHEGNSRWETDVDGLRRACSTARRTTSARSTSRWTATRVISAGIPWYSTVFGRDSIITSLQTLPLQPRDRARHAALPGPAPGQREDPYTEEQPGKILHELRRGEMARSRRDPARALLRQRRRDAALADPAARDLALDRRHRAGPRAAAQRRARARVDRPLRRSGRRRLRGVLPHLGEGAGQPGLEGLGRRRALSRRPPARSRRSRWSRSRATCTTPSSGWPSCTGTWGSPSGRRRSGARRPSSGTGSAPRSGSRSSGIFALALDGQKRPMPTATTNAGHLLWSRVPTPEVRAAGSRPRFLEPDFFSGWGVRTLSAAHPVFNPMSYHNGSIWPHDNAILVLGMALHGHARAALPIVRALYEAGVHSEFQRLPELYCGMTRQTGLAAGRLSGELLAPGVGVGLALHAAAGAARDLPRGPVAHPPRPRSGAARFPRASSPSRGSRSAAPAWRSSSGGTARGRSPTSSASRATRCRCGSS